MTLSQQNMGQSSTFLSSVSFFITIRFSSVARVVPSTIRSSSTVASRSNKQQQKDALIIKKKSQQPMAVDASRIIWRDAVQTSNSLENKPWPDASAFPSTAPFRTTKLITPLDYLHFQGMCACGRLSPAPSSMLSTI